MAPARFVLLLSLLFLSQLVLHSAQESEHNPKCPSFQCGRLGNVSFPFTKESNPDCGLILLNCTGPEPEGKFVDEEQYHYHQVYHINYSTQTVEINYRMTPSHILNSNVCATVENSPSQVSPSLSYSFPDSHFLFKCMKRERYSISESQFLHQFRNYTGCNEYDLYFYDNPRTCLPTLPQTLSNHCYGVHLPNTRLQSSDFCLADNLTLQWDGIWGFNWHVLPACLDCHRKGGQCLSSPDKIFRCGNLRKGSSSTMMKIWIAVSISGAAIIVIISVSIYIFRMKATNSTLPWQRKAETTIVFEAFLKKHGSLALKRYSFKEIKTMTNHFKCKLGQGGYGSVFKGNLRDGSSAAVKVLNESKGNGEEFINEVASISKTSHVNIVSLLGYCFEESKRALVYEFMPNGSLENYIYDETRSGEHTNLGCETFYQISIGIARGLEYLHRGCSTRILHFDIKPHNILLDQDFCPKISDFGLAKLCPRNESIISMLGTRGTVGYIAPEVFSRNFGGVSHKSDVYSYGMMILEMAGGRRNVDEKAPHTSEIYFPNWIYSHVESDKDLEIQGVVTEAEREMARKMILVGLWCIQTSPSDRPSMSRVLEMLESNLEVLTIPPKPYLSSPTRIKVSSSNN